MSNFHFDYDTFYNYYTDDTNLKTDDLSPKEIWFYKKGKSKYQIPTKSILSNKYIKIKDEKLYISEIKSENKELLFTIPTTIGDKIWDFHFHFGKDKIKPPDVKYQLNINSKDNRIPIVYFHKTTQHPDLHGKDRKNCYYHPSIDVDNIEDIICLQAMNSKMGKMFPPNTQDFKIIKEIISRPFPKKSKKTFLEALSGNNTTQIKPSGKGGTKKKTRRHRRKSVRRNRRR